LKKITSEYIPNLDKNAACFELAAEGFVFKDCFVVSIQGSKEYQLVVVLEKNIRDERPINCPACRSKNVQGNSYPILNVRSWECENILCPDRSKYNRGKRFSYVSYRRQKAMEDERNIISQHELATWHLDKVDLLSYQSIFDMACTFYSFAGDVVEVNSSNLQAKEIYKHRIIHFAPEPNDYSGLYREFKNSCYFKRYNYDNDSIDLTFKISKAENRLSEYNILYEGDSRTVLKNLQEESITGAVTSPPYYNAKSYSQWDNIYCYLYDMRNIAKEVYRVLIPGGVFLYNIFDYFDNERNIVFSAMGNKRMILGAYIIDLFRRIGFELQGNIIWFKGEIQGNRNFNQGNNTPYYQAPLNCWEHILIFSKGDPLNKFTSLQSEIRKIRPFIKYVRGKNVLGHDAPFPEDIPNILLDCMSESDTILDPFSGSFTTGLAAYKKHIHSVSIEKQSEYVELSKKRLNEIKEKNKFQQTTLPFMDI
jgi:DNA modification methylase